MGENCVVKDRDQEMAGCGKNGEEVASGFLKLRAQWWLWRVLKQSLSDKYIKRERGAQDELSRMLWYDSLLRWGGYVSKVALEWKRKAIEQAQERVL